MHLFAFGIAQIGEATSFPNYHSHSVLYGTVLGCYEKM